MSFFSMWGLFFSKSLSIFTKMGFSSGRLGTKSQWSMNFLSEVDRHSRLSFVCLPPCLFLSFMTEDCTEGQTHAGQVLYHWTTPYPYFLFLLWRQALTDLPRLALTSLGGINQPLTWEPPQPLGQACTAVPDSQSLDCEELTEGRCSSWRPATHEEPVYREVLRQR